MKIKAFTLIELLVVMVIVGILAGMSFAQVNQYITKAKYGKVAAEFNNLQTAVILAQTISEKTLQDITETTGTMNSCATVINAGASLTNPTNHQTCLTDWTNALTKIGAVSGVDISSFILDPWGAPYLLDEGGEEDCGYSILASAGKNGDFSDKTLRIEIFSPVNTVCNGPGLGADEEESVGEPEIEDGDPEVITQEDINALNALFPSFPNPKFPLLVNCYFESEICKPVVVDCIPQKNRNGCATKTINFYEKIGEISE